jgi:hypothetical protein
LFFFNLFLLGRENWKRGWRHEKPERRNEEIEYEVLRTEAVCTEPEKAEEEVFAKVANSELPADFRAFVFAIAVLFFNKNQK